MALEHIRAYDRVQKDYEEFQRDMLKWRAALGTEWVLEQDVNPAGEAPQLIEPGKNRASMCSALPLSFTIFTILAGILSILHMKEYVEHFIHWHFPRFSLVLATVLGIIVGLPVFF